MPTGLVDFQRLFEKSPARYLVLTPSLQIAAVTDAYLQATGKTRAIVGRPVFEVFPDNPADPKATGMANVKAHFERVVATRAPDIMPVQQYDIERPAGQGGGFEERHWQLAGVPILGDDGAVEHILHFVEDVTDRIRMDRQRDEGRREVGALQEQTTALAAEVHRRTQEQSALNEALQQALRERQRAQARAEAERHNLREFIQQAPAVLCILRGPTHVFELANPTYLRLVGQRDILGKPVREALPELTGQGFYELLDGVYTTGTPFLGNEMEARLDRGRGVPERAILNIVYQPTRDPEGAIDGIAVYATEVTELVEARDRERAARQAAEESEQHFRTLFDTMPQLGWTTYPDGVGEFYNRRWFEYTGLTMEQIRREGTRGVYDPEMFDDIAATWRRAVAAGVPFEMEYPIRRHDGVFRWFLNRATPVRREDGTIVRWVGINTDIQDMRSAHALTLEMTAQSHEAEQALRELRAAKEQAERRVAELEASREKGS
jgi:PAS domain S-box-containing protein